MFKKLKVFFRNNFIAGLLIVLPISITMMVLSYLFIKVDSLFGPLINRLIIQISNFFPEPFRISTKIPGLGIITTILLIFLLGLLTKNIFGKKILQKSEAILARIPLARSIYTASKQLIESLPTFSEGNFNNVVLVEYPRKGIYVVGFVTGKVNTVISTKIDNELINVFIPTTPNPTSGFLVIVHQDEVIPIDITVEEGIKLVISGGMIAPDKRDVSKSNDDMLA
ncbi:MAG: DUF502 domain-containing protein [bacterium]